MTGKHSTLNRTRRSVITTTGSIAAVGIAGCTSILDDDDNGRDREITAQVSASESEIAEEIQVRSAVDGEESHQLWIFIAANAHVTMESLTMQGTHYISNRSWDPDEEHVVQLSLPNQFADGSLFELSLFPGLSEDDVPNRPVEEDIPEGSTFDVNPEMSEAFDVVVDVDSGMIELTERDGIPFKEEEHEAA